MSGKKDNEVKEKAEKENKSTMAENILALKDFFAEEEVKASLAWIVETYKKSSQSNVLINICFMIAAFVCIGALAYYELMPKGTTGVLAGIIIGYFFKKND